MSKKRGLSYDEKRVRMMELFYEKEDLFSLKELERVCHKEKGIVSQSVKEVLQSLVDDNMVDTDKIGTGVYYWAFPSKAGQTRNVRIKKLEDDCQATTERIASLKEALVEAKKGREESEDRSAQLAELAECEAHNATLKADLEKYRDLDPEIIKEMKTNTATAREAAERWTDNIFTLKKHCVEKFNIDSQSFHRGFGIPEEFDYPDQ